MTRDFDDLTLSYFWNKLCDYDNTLELVWFGMVWFGGLNKN